VLILVREVGVTVLRFWVIRHGVIAASRGGKIKTVLQIIAIGLYILPVGLGWAKAAVMGAAVVVTVVTGIDYVARALRLRRVSGARPASARPASARPATASPATAGPAGTRPAAGPATAGPASAAPPSGGAAEAGGK
jgi:CDP-diacylglycerol---glycerol-3-phosphate 3-phosphatidyltransferase